MGHVVMLHAGLIRHTVVLHAGFISFFQSLIKFLFFFAGKAPIDTGTFTGI